MWGAGGVMVNGEGHTSSYYGRGQVWYYLHTNIMLLLERTGDTICTHTKHFKLLWARTGETICTYKIRLLWARTGDTVSTSQYETLLFWHTFYGTETKIKLYHTLFQSPCWAKKIIQYYANAGWEYGHTCHSGLWSWRGELLLRLRRSLGGCVHIHWQWCRSWQR